MTTTYQESEYLLPKVKQAITHMAKFGWPDRGSFIRDERGYEIGFTSPHRTPHYEHPTWFNIAVKRRQYQGIYGSFMPKLIAKAITRQNETGLPHRLLLFIGSDDFTIDNGYVLNPKRASNQASRRTYVDSKRDIDVEIFDVALEGNAVTLREWLKGSKRLPGPILEGETRETTLRSYGETVQ